MPQWSQFRQHCWPEMEGIWPSLLPTPGTSALDSKPRLCVSPGSPNDGAWLEGEVHMVERAAFLCNHHKWGLLTLHHVLVR